MKNFDKTWDLLGETLYNEKCVNPIGIDIDFDQKNEGDELCGFDGESFTINMFGSKFELGYVNHWPVKSSEETRWCKKDDIDIQCDELYEMVENFIKCDRDYKINKIL